MNYLQFHTYSAVCVQKLFRLLTGGRGPETPLKALFTGPTARLYDGAHTINICQRFGVVVFCNWKYYNTKQKGYGEERTSVM